MPGRGPVPVNTGTSGRVPRAASLTSSRRSAFTDPVTSAKSSADTETLHERVVRGSRRGREVAYEIADDHVTHIVLDALTHIREDQP